MKYKSAPLCLDKKNVGGAEAPDARKRGQQHYRTYLDAHDVELMRELHLPKNGLTIREIACKFEVPWSTARDIIQAPAAGAPTESRPEGTDQSERNDWR